MSCFWCLLPVSINILDIPSSPHFELSKRKLILRVVITAFNGLAFVRIIEDRNIWALTSPSMRKCVLVLTTMLAVVQFATSLAIITGNPSAVQVAGINTYIASLYIQLGFILYILAFVVSLYTTLTKAQRKIMVWVTLSLGMISIRTVYRIVELNQVFRPDSLLPHKEVFFYLFEAVPVLGALGVWGVLHVGRIVIDEERKEMDEGFEYQAIEQEGIPLRNSESDEQNG